MSIATKQLQQSFHTPNNKQKQQQARIFKNNKQQTNVVKSIDTTIRGVEHVTKNLIKSKQLLRQTPVVEATEAEAKPEDKKDKTSQSQETDDIVVKELEDTHSNAQEEDDCEAKDYQVYENGKVNEFFENEMLEKSNKISDICLVNDHFILVKMPQQGNTSTNNNLAEAAARRKEFRSLKEYNDKILNESERENKKLCHYLIRNRNCITRIAPINEEPEELSDHENKIVKTNSKLHCLKIKSCWQSNEQDVETYQTTTKIFKSIKNDSLETSCNQQKSNMQQTTLSKPATEKTECVGIQNPPDIQTITGSVLKSSLQYQVSLHNYGSLIDGSNNNNLDKINSPPKRRKCPRFESFYWLLRPFRGKYRKAKPKIQAVVYKTYFVKWTKPPDTLKHGYGVKSSKSSDIEVSVLRRCRSAIF